MNILGIDIDIWTMYIFIFALAYPKPERAEVAEANRSPMEKEYAAAFMRAWNSLTSVTHRSNMDSQNIRWN